MEKKNGLRLMERIFGKKDVCHYNAQYFTKIQKGKKENDETELSY